MKLSDLISKSEILRGEDLLSRIVGKPVCDSRKVQPRDVFFDISNNEDYVKAAAARGCAVTVREYSDSGDGSSNTVHVKNVRLSYAEACEKYAGDPTKDMHLIAVTGTNGKTSTTHILAAILRRAGYKTGIIGTVGNFIGDEITSADYTTPPPDVLSELFQRMKNDGVKYVVLEASSHALDQDRLGGLTFDAGIFTNLTRDHLDYHKTMENLAKAKAKLFPACRASIINLDDTYAKQMAFAASGDVYFCSEKDEGADFYADNIECGIAKTNFRISSYFGDIYIKSKLTGSFNVY
ncbi:MAG: hypothetical protein KBS59_01610, partial [Clostridiales bacterium]|nr:hypothetical protein [Clostridiales bacterium]